MSIGGPHEVLPSHGLRERVAPRGARAARVLPENVILALS